MAKIGLLGLGIKNQGRRRTPIFGYWREPGRVIGS